MSENEFYELLERYQSGRCTPAEKERVKTFLDQNERKASVVHLWSDTEQAKTKSRMWLEIQRAALSTKPSFWTSTRVAASVILILTAGLLAYMRYEDFDVPEEITKTTRPGQRSVAVLSDGTRIYLNSDSELVYPEEFDGDVRTVRLSGEAFFEVARDETKPFVVLSGDLKTTVLGTSFNIQAYSEQQNVEVTVATGKVSVQGAGLQKLLTPGQQAIFNYEDIQVSDVDVQTFSSWTKGILIFDHARIADILKRMEQYYGVDIDMELASDDCELYLYFDHFSLEEALRQIKLVSGINYQVSNNRKIVITGTACK